ncbi:hypothetical protein SLEP1_g49329 [Rubroshorea leprosula]|uniref:BED-type domain-containing protein n=1 Tax=Rubroshorea leprosula TaxID=152421 RepID=A0AAV5LXR1_9ROSI|nr:hypothetical protein SLEP1_g49329 [Rubroshorea leprosula]
MIPFKLSASHRAITTTPATLTAHLQLQGWVVLFLLLCGHLNYVSVIPFKLSASHRAVTTTTASLQHSLLTTAHVQLQGRVILFLLSRGLLFYNSTLNSFQTLQLQPMSSQESSFPSIQIPNESSASIISSAAATPTSSSVMASLVLESGEDKKDDQGHKRPLTSKAWNHYRRQKINGHWKAICVYCNKHLEGTDVSSRLVEERSESSDNNGNFFNLFDKLEENDNEDDESEVNFKQ